MARPVTLFIGQWTKIMGEITAKWAADFGYDGLELACCWGDHIDVHPTAKSDKYCQGRCEAGGSSERRPGTAVTDRKQASREETEEPGQAQTGMSEEAESEKRMHCNLQLKIEFGYSESKGINRKHATWVAAMVVLAGAVVLGVRLIYEVIVAVLQATNLP